MKLQLPAFVPNRKTVVVGESDHQLVGEVGRLQLVAGHCRFVRLDDDNSMSHPPASEFNGVQPDCLESCCLGWLFWKLLGYNKKLDFA